VGAPPLDISVDPAIADALALGVVALDDVRPGGRPEEARRLLERLEGETRALLAGAGSGAAFEGARRLYKRFGIDPTRYRPSAEQLARRIARGDPFPRVNALVDAVNLCQLATRLCYGLYDLDAVEPPVVARAGRAGESYEGIRKGAISLEGKPALFDARGGFGNPTSDSDRAKTTGATRRALAVVFGAPEMARAEWDRVLERTVDALLLHVDAAVVERRVVLGGGA
jgi:DNA/RNA-binding domain of Phe-tRNA-synthetase-like protein